MRNQEHRIRIPDDLYQKLHGLGLKNERSATAEAIAVLRKHLTKKVSRKRA